MKEKKLPKKPRPIALYDLSDDDFIAFKVKCTIGKTKINDVLCEFIKKFIKEVE